MPLSLIELPYDSGRFNVRMGRGPITLIDAGLAERLRDCGHDVRVTRVRLSDRFDVLNQSEGRANSYACAGGMSVDDLCAALALAAESGEVTAASLTSYDPGCDSDGRISNAAERIIAALAA